MRYSRVTASIALLVCIAFLLAGCGRLELYQDLNEKDANEILVLLSDNGIKANKKKNIRQNEISYSIEVRESDMVRARVLLVRHNLPRRKELGLTGVYKEKGLIPTPDEQKARFLLALKGEIINSLERIPQIVDADVVLNVPTKDEFASAEAQHRQRPTASVVLKAKLLDRGVAPISESKVQQFVSNAVEGMNPRDVTVVVSYLSDAGGRAKPGDVKVFPTRRPDGRIPEVSGPPPVFESELIGLRLDSDSKARLKVYLLVFFIMLVLISSALIIVIVQGSRMRKVMQSMHGPAGEHPAIEGEVLGAGHPELPGPDESDEL